MPRSFSLAYLTIPGIEALDQIRIAADAGYDYVSLRTIPMGLPGEPQLCLEKDPALYQKIRQALKDHQIRLLDIELVRIREDQPEDYRAAFEAGASLGATDVISSVWTTDVSFAVDRYGKICEQAAEFGLDVDLEFPAVSCMPSLSQVAALQQQVGKPNLKLFVDTLHAHLDGVTPQQISSIDADRYGLIHLCDCPHRNAQQDMVQIVREGREYCGHGEADLAGMIRALPDRPCSIELPNVQHIQKYGAFEHARRCLETAKALFYTHGL